MCSADDQKSLAQLKDIYSRVDAISPDTIIEENLLGGKLGGTAVKALVSVIERLTATVSVVKPLGVVLDFNGNPITAYEAAAKYNFKVEANIAGTGTNLETSVTQFVKDEAGKDFIGVLNSKVGNNNGIDLAYAKMVNGRPQLVIGEAKAGDSALTAFGENQAKTLDRNLAVIKQSILDIPDVEIQRMLLQQLERRTYTVELYTTTGNAAKTAGRIDDALIDRLGQPVQRVVTFGKQ